MRTPLIALLVALAVCEFPVATHAEATIEGTVQIPMAGPPPPVRTRYQSKAPLHVGPPQPPVAVVYLEGQFPSQDSPKAPAPAQMEQKNFQFGAYVLPVQKGAKVLFPNQDDAYHNVFSYSKAKHFDLGRYLKDETPPALVFDKVGVVKLFCEIHDHMRGTILVLDTPHFVATLPDGHYRLEHLPAGKYILKTWLNENTVLERPVELVDGAALKVDFPGR
jgi:plastocyanin